MRTERPWQGLDKLAAILTGHYNFNKVRAGQMCSRL